MQRSYKLIQLDTDTPNWQTEDVGEESRACYDIYMRLPSNPSRTVS